MKFWKKLFGKNGTKDVQKPSEQSKDFEQLSETEKLHNVAKLIKMEAEDGNAEEQYNLGMMFATGKGPYGHGTYTKDIGQAKKWLEKSAAQNYIPSIVELAMLYGSGEGLKEDPKKAHELFLQAANLNDPFSQYVVGLNLFNGNGVEVDINEAVQWYLKAAKQGENHAQFEMGMICEIGGDIESARKWYTKSANQGNENAKQKLNEL